MISTRSVGLLIDTVVCLTLAKWETVSGRFGGYFRMIPRFHRAVCDYFTFGSAPVPAITRAEKPVLSDSKFSPFPFRHCMCECPRQRPDQSSGFSQSQSYPGRGTQPMSVWERP